MVYRFHKRVNSKTSTGSAVTRDSTVIVASSSWTWAIGKDIGIVIEWAESKGFSWRVSEK